MSLMTCTQLDDGADANKRHTDVKFNADPSIDCLLLTTHVGGLGLTPVRADTVIRSSPSMKDLQVSSTCTRS